MPHIITGTGSYLPARQVSNQDLLAVVENFDAERAGCGLDQWIQRRFGVRTRRWAADDESTGDMATEAARRALNSAAVRADEIDVIVMSTATSDHVAPHSVSIVQANLGCRAVFHQVQAACSGFLDALMVGHSLMATLGYRRALVIAGEKMTHIVDKRDFRMIGLFADGAGAVVVEDLPVADRYGFQGFFAGSDGSRGQVLRVPAGGSRQPLTAERLAAGEHYLVSEFRDVWAFATETTVRCIREAARRAKVTPADIDWVVPHHASVSILEQGIREAGMTTDKLVVSMDHTGNTSSASVPTALDEAARAGRFKDGDRILLLALGGGLSWASTVYVWRDLEQARRARRLSA